mgnify:FL=1|jgi:hypothetical protein|tara:strand:+ start:25 stop:390 length:366 start_codon:yes stop_codon:yes gene_type:complete
MNNKYIVFLLSLILIISIHYVLVFLLESPTSNNSKPVENNSSNIEENKHIPFVEKNFEEPVDNSELLLRWLSKEGDSIYASVMNDKDQTIEKMTSPIAEDINNTTQLTSWAGNISYSPAFF